MNDHRQMSWVCPLCRAVITVGARDDGRDQVRSTCLLRPDWEALPEAVRDEIGAMLDVESPIRAGYRLAELAGHQRRTMEYMMLASYRNSLRRRGCSCAEAVRGNASWACPSCDRPLLGCDHIRGETCAPCRSAPAWEALPQTVRDEVGAMLAAGAVEPATYRLRDLDENRLDTFDYVLMTVYAQGRLKQVRTGGTRPARFPATRRSPAPRTEFRGPRPAPAPEA